MSHEFSVVLLNVVSLNQISYLSPWGGRTTSTSTSTAFVIEHNGNKILMTNEHCIANAKFIVGRFAGNDKEFVLDIIRSDKDCDLAILSSNDPWFLETAIPLSLAPGMTVPKVGTKINMLGFPYGTEQCTSTRGIITSSDIEPYHDQGPGLSTAKIDAIMTYGNSGGPAIDEDNKTFVVGVARAKTSDPDAPKLITPIPIIQLFLSGWKFTSVVFGWEKLNNPLLRQHYQLPDDISGILITSVLEFSSGYPILKPGDILRKVNGYPVSNKGNIDHPHIPGHQIPYQYAFTNLGIEGGNEITVTLLRNQKEMTLSIPLNRNDIQKIVLAKSESNKEEANYILVGGLILQKLTRNYIYDLQEFYQKQESIDGYPRHLEEYITNYSITKTEKLKAVYVITNVLPTEKTRGYYEFQYAPIKEVNGIQITCSKELIKALYTNKNETHVFNTVKDKIIVVPNNLESDKKTSEFYGVIPSVSNRFAEKIKRFGFLSSKNETELTNDKEDNQEQEIMTKTK